MAIDVSSADVSATVLAARARAKHEGGRRALRGCTAGWCTGRGGRFLRCCELEKQSGQSLNLPFVRRRHQNPSKTCTWRSERFAPHSSVLSISMSKDRAQLLHVAEMWIRLVLDARIQGDRGVQLLVPMPVACDCPWAIRLRYVYWASTGVRRLNVMYEEEVGFGRWNRYGSLSLVDAVSGTRGQRRGRTANKAPHRGK